MIGRYGDRDAYRRGQYAVVHRPDGSVFIQDDLASYRRTTVPPDPQAVSDPLSVADRPLAATARPQFEGDALPYVTLSRTRYPDRGVTIHEVQAPNGQIAEIQRLHRWSAGRGW